MLLCQGKWDIPLFVWEHEVQRHLVVVTECGKDWHIIATM